MDNHEFDFNKVLALLLEKMPLGVIVTDEQGSIQYVNQTAERIRNVKREKINGHNIINCHGKSTQEKVIRAMERLKASEANSFTRMVEDQKQGRVYLNTYTSIWNEEQQYVGMAVLTNDITEQRKLENEKAHTARIQMETINNLTVQYHSLLMNMLQSISSIVEAKDPFLCQHSNHVCEVALKLYEKKYGMDANYITLKEAALLHDLGKLCIPDLVLNKEGTLTALEYDLVKQHADIGFKILEPIGSVSDLSRAVRHHHERFDGSGYPDGLEGNQIPILSRIIFIADTYDAMRSNRPYRKALSFAESLDEIQSQAGRQFDPEWVEIFVELALTGSL